MMKFRQAVLTGTAASVLVLSAAPALAQANMAQTLAQADANSDGQVSRAELIRFRKTAFGRMDVNGDGFVRGDDVNKWAFMLGDAAAKARWDQLRATSDANKDMRVSSDEFVKGPTPGFDTADANKDNVVDAREMSALKAR